MPNEIVIDAVRINTADGDVFVCDVPARQRRSGKTLTIIFCLIGITALVSLYFWIGSHSPLSRSATPAELRSVMKFGETLSSIEGDLNDYTARFVKDGSLAV